VRSCSSTLPGSRANADVDSLRSRSIAQNHLKELFEETAGLEKKNFEDLVTTVAQS